MKFIGENMQNSFEVNFTKNFHVKIMLMRMLFSRKKSRDAQLAVHVYGVFAVVL